MQLNQGLLLLKIVTLCCQVCVSLVYFVWERIIIYYSVVISCTVKMLWKKSLQIQMLLRSVTSCSTFMIKRSRRLYWICFIGGQTFTTILESLLVLKCLVIRGQVYSIIRKMFRMLYCYGLCCKVAWNLVLVKDPKLLYIRSWSFWIGSLQVR